MPGEHRAHRHKPAFDVCQQSATVNTLLDLIGKGYAHVSLATEVARAVITDAPQEPSSAIACLASCGTYGKNASNEERDFMNWTKGCYGFELEPYMVELMLQVL